MSMDFMPEIPLPAPGLKGSLSLEETIARRRSVRRFAPQPVTQQQLARILWATQGAGDASGGCRTVPSAGATYPLEIFVVCGESCIEKISAGVYHYDASKHFLTLHREGDLRRELAGAASNQRFIATAPLDIVVCAVYERTLARYGARGERYVHMEAGHAGQNIYLQAAALSLATVAVGVFDDEEVRAVLRLDSQYKPLYIMPVGRAA